MLIVSFFSNVSFFIAMDKKQARKKRKQDKSPEKNHQHDDKVASATRMSSIVSKSGQKKAKSKKLEKKMTGV